MSKGEGEEQGHPYPDPMREMSQSSNVPLTLASATAAAINNLPIQSPSYRNFVPIASAASTVTTPPNPKGRRSSAANGRATSSTSQGNGGGSLGVTGHHRSVGPELSTPARLAASSNGAYIPTGEPPYTPPSDVVYPPERIPNPHVGDMRPQPVLDNLPANTLFRPKYLPADFDDRLDKTSVWMGVEKESSRAVYFLPPTCLCCKHPAVAQHCDRGWPNCARCIGRGVTCIPGVAWGVMRPKGKRRNLKAEIAKNKAATNQAMQVLNDRIQPIAPKITPEQQRYPSSEKGKERAVVDLPPTLSQAQAIVVGAVADVDMLEEEVQDQGPGGRGKRIKKKRRLSAAGEIDSNAVNHDGSATKKARRKSTRDSIGIGADENVPLSKADEAYFSRLGDNSRRPPLTSMKGPCPVWANTRRSLQVAAEYFREPKITAGGSVEIGAGGVARGVILEGDTNAQGIFWGQGKDVGTVITSIGHPRRQRRKGILPIPEADSSPFVPPEPVQPFLRPSTPPYNILPSVVHVQDQSKSTSSGNGFDRFWSTRPNDDSPVIQEAPEIAALLTAQRARTPVALAVSQDYVAVPFKVPRPFIVLGWFWITDAWLEPVMPDLELFTDAQRAPSGPPDRVIWKFRFEWCTGEQETPWWSSSSDPNRRVDSPVIDHAETSWKVSEPGLNGSTTVRLCTIPEVDFDPGLQHLCDNCKAVSERVYSTGAICLNEECAWFFGDASSIYNHIGPVSSTPGLLRPCKRVTPESLGLRLRLPEPNGKTIELRRDHLGREYWRGWVCRKCGLAQERSRWTGWNCEACGHSICPQRRAYTEEDLRPPFRPICTGPRQEDGYATWPFPATRTWALFKDDIKVVKHLLDDGLGQGAEVHHALHHEGGKAHEVVSAILEGLQEQGSEEVPFKRYPATNDNRRPANIVLSPFYTYLNGPETVPNLTAFPSGHAVDWPGAPVVCLDSIDLINDRAGRMFSGQKDLLVAVCPPALPNALQPRITIEPNTTIAFLYIGSDGSMRFKKGDRQGKQGEMTIQHGDVVGIKAGVEPIEISPRMDTFGFLCIARRAQIMALPVPAPTTAPSSFAIDPELVDHPAPEMSLLDSPAGVPILPVLSPPPLPAVPTKLAEVPLIDWYIGGLPIDDSQPMRIYPLFRPENSTTPKIDDNDEGNIIYLEEDNSPDRREFAALSPMPMTKEQEAEQRLLNKEAALIAKQSLISVSGGKSKAGKAERQITPVSVSVSKRGRGGRKSLVIPNSTPPTTPSETGTGAGAGTGKSRGKGRTGPRASKGRTSTTGNGVEM